MRCKRGDLAEIVKSIDGLMVGRIVEVVEFAGVHSKLGPIWQVRSTRDDLVSEYGAIGGRVHCADDWLKPIRPDDKASDRETSKPLDLIAA